MSCTFTFWPGADRRLPRTVTTGVVFSLNSMFCSSLPGITLSIIAPEAAGLSG